MIVKGTKNEVRMRIKYVRELLMNDVPETDIVSAIMEKYAIGKAMAYRYHYIAFASLEEKDNKQLKRKIDFYKARKWRSIMDMDPKEKRTAAGVAVVNKVINEIAVLDGIVTKRIEVVGDKNNPIQVQHAHAHIHRHEIDYSAMTTEVLEALVISGRKNQQVEE
ncbi:MAG: hypothetical protein IPQ08_15435 [Chitinophagaceae bacterium]|nr:hypothetical protein [Chitinophagaceae bacterium]